MSYSVIYVKQFLFSSLLFLRWSILFYHEGRVLGFYDGHGFVCLLIYVIEQILAMIYFPFLFLIVTCIIYHNALSFVN